METTKKSKWSWIAYVRLVIGLLTAAAPIMLRVFSENGDLATAIAVAVGLVVWLGRDECMSGADEYRANRLFRGCVLIASQIALMVCVLCVGLDVETRLQTAFLAGLVNAFANHLWKYG